MRFGPAAQRVVIALAVNQIDIDRTVVGQHGGQSRVTLRASGRLHEQRQSPAGVVGNAGGITHVNRQRVGVQPLPGAVHLALKFHFFLRAGKLLLYPLLGVLTALFCAARLDAERGKWIEAGRLRAPGAVHQLLIALIVLLVQPPLPRLLLQILNRALTGVLRVRSLALAVSGLDTRVRGAAAGK